MAGSSRQLFSFARDKGVPCHGWVSRVPRGYDVPVAAVLVSATWACVFHCIYIGSALAFNIIMSIGTVSLLTSYMVSIWTITWKRLRGHPSTVEVEARQDRPLRQHSLSPFLRCCVCLCILPACAESRTLGDELGHRRVWRHVVGGLRLLYTSRKARLCRASRVR